MLAKAYNQMRHHLKEQEESRQQFVSNVSHELKTPMTSMKVLSDSLIQQAQVGEVPNEMYEDFMIDISHEIDGRIKSSRICWNWSRWTGSRRSSTLKIRISTT